MKKLNKSLVAAGLATALLLGGGTTLALWNAGASVGTGKIQSGSLKVETFNGAWSDTIDRWVPGDFSTWTSTGVKIHAAGDNLKLKLTVNTPDPATLTPADKALLAALKYEVSATNVTGATANTVGGVTTLTGFDTSGGTAITADVAVKVTFDADNADPVTQNATIQLKDIEFAVQQVL